MRSGGVQATFTSSADASAGRVDIADRAPRRHDRRGRHGLLAALLFDAVGAGPGKPHVTGTGNGAGRRRRSRCSSRPSRGDRR